MLVIIIKRAFILFPISMVNTWDMHRYDRRILTIYLAADCEDHNNVFRHVNEMGLGRPKYDVILGGK
jgi:hypothetical protein